MKITKLSSNKKKQLESRFLHGGQGLIVGKVSDAFDEARKYVTSGVAVLPRGDGSYVVERLDVRGGGVGQNTTLKGARGQAKQLRMANRRRHDVGFSRGAQLLQDPESTETTAQIAQSAERNLSRNWDTYRLLFEKAAKRR